MTWNVYLVCVGPRCWLADSPDLKRRRDEMGHFIAKQHPDIVFLQEVFQREQFDRVWQDSGLKYGHWFGPASDLAMLSRWQLADAQFYPLSWQGSTREDCRRLVGAYQIGLALAHVTTESGQNFTLANTHTLPRRADIPGFAEAVDAISPQRQLHILEIAALLATQAPRDQAIIFGGDFNMNQQAVEYTFFRAVVGLTDGLRQAAQARGTLWDGLCSYCGDNPYVTGQGNTHEGILDYVMVSPGDFKILAGNILAESDRFSDHRAVVVDLEPTGQTHGPQVHLPERGQLQEIARALEATKQHPYCYLSILGWVQQQEAVRFLLGVIDAP